MLAFLAAAVCVPAIQCVRRPMPPKDLGELAERITTTQPELHVKPVYKDSGLDGGFYLTREPRAWDSLARLSSGSNWEGVVRVVPLPEGYGSADPDDEHKMIVEHFLFTGDPVMLERIHRTLAGN
jgi:hypothetical protein